MYWPSEFLGRKVILRSTHPLDSGGKEAEVHFIYLFYWSITIEYSPFSSLPLHWPDTCQRHLFMHSQSLNGCIPTSESREGAAEAEGPWLPRVSGQGSWYLFWVFSLPACGAEPTAPRCAGFCRRSRWRRRAAGGELPAPTLLLPCGPAGKHPIQQGIMHVGLWNVF